MKPSAIMAVLAVTVCVSAPSIAAPLIYHGNNPDITPGANPGDQTGLAAEAALTRPHAPVASNGATSQSDAELVRNSVLASVSSTISQQLTGTSSTSGTVNFGDGSYATYSTANGIRTIITHDLDGTSTTISFPIQ